jgi:hypothetical protein
VRAGPECLECLRKLSRQAIDLATRDSALKAELEGRVEKILGGFSLDIVPPDLSNEFHRTIKEISGNSDPYHEWKLREIETAKRMFSKLKPKDDLRGCIEIAAQGNAIDYFVDEQTLMKDLTETPRFAIDDIDVLEQKLEKVREVLYLADNAGEVYFDFPLLKFLSERVKVEYVVKIEPIQNDVTVEDLRATGLELPAEIVAGPGTVGIYLNRASYEFRRRFQQAGLVIAKGMGNYETLSELPQTRRFFYIFRAKCAPVARSLGVKLDEYVAMLR